MYTNQQVELLREALKQNSASMESTEIQYIFHNALMEHDISRKWQFLYGCNYRSSSKMPKAYIQLSKLA